MDIASKKIDYRSQAEKDYQTAVFNYKSMFRDISPEHLKDISKLESLVAKTDAQIRAEYVKNKPASKVKRQREKAERKQLQDEEKNQARIRAEILRQQEKKKAGAAKEKWKLEMESESRKRIPTRNIDHSVLIPVKIDAKTTIYIKPGVDPEQARQRFIDRRGGGDITALIAGGHQAKGNHYDIWFEKVKTLAKDSGVALSKYHLDFFQASFAKGATPKACLKRYVDQTNL